MTNTVFLTTPGILTYTGRRVSLVTPRPEDICLQDITHSLARIGRYTGHGDHFISVAQHCVHVSRICPPTLARQGLLHDAAEAYVGDVSSPLKGMLLGVADLSHEWQTVLEGALDVRTMRALREALPGYRAIEARFHFAIGMHFGVVWHPAIKWHDTQSMLSERRDNGPRGCTDEEWCGAQDPPPPLDHVRVKTPEEAEAAFALRAWELGLR
jgi:hypothetical protein